MMAFVYCIETWIDSHLDKSNSNNKRQGKELDLQKQYQDLFEEYLKEVVYLILLQLYPQNDLDWLMAWMIFFYY